MVITRTTTIIGKEITTPISNVKIGGITGLTISNKTTVIIAVITACVIITTVIIFATEIEASSTQTDQDSWAQYCTMEHRSCSLMLTEPNTYLNNNRGRYYHKYRVYK
jgi:vancomycin permeability regulator SanA